MNFDFLLRNVIAGLATALLAVSAVLSPFAMIPGMLVGLGWGLASALASTAVAFVLLGLWINVGFSVGMALSVGLPVVLFVRLALLSRTYEAENGQTERAYYPPERLIVWAGGLSAAVSFLAFALAANQPGGLPGVLENLLLNNRHLFRDVETAYQIELTDVLVKRVAQTMIVLAPLTWMLLILGSLQAAQGIARFFKINLRPSLDVDAVRLPGWLEYVLAALVVLLFLTSGWVLVFVLVLACLCLTAYFLLGLAVIHAISRTWNGRPVLLAAVYLVILLIPWAAVFVSIAGLVESRMGIRARFNGSNR